MQNAETHNQIFQLNGISYNISQLPPEGKRLLELLTNAQGELQQIENRKELIQAAHEHLITQLKAILPAEDSKGTELYNLLGHASKTIPTTTADKPLEEIPELPSALPELVQKKN